MKVYLIICVLLVFLFYCGNTETLFGDNRNNGIHRDYSLIYFYLFAFFNFCFENNFSFSYFKNNIYFSAIIYYKTIQRL